ncbi:MAG: alpha-amylase family glycosyl hydrolase [Eubacteriales bacterium]|nr:alpha-amylase family glycosyl hydrolase [Eubacteriales bacterium]
MQMKKILSVVLVLCTIASSMALVSVSAAENSAEIGADAKSTEMVFTRDEAEAVNDYGLMENIQDGNILHCFCWKHTDIQEMLPEIAEAGFSAVQLSPLQPVPSNGAWWQFYQPRGFSLGSNPTGNRETLTALCAEADKYGIKVIVDVVANHLTGDHRYIQEDLKDAKYWHTFGEVTDWLDRNQVINGDIGMQDLNTSDTYVQQCVKNYVAELKACGVDGIRWDAAKHIGLPSEGDDFWKVVTEDSDLYYYGEILGDPGVSVNSKKGKKILNEYMDYMYITDTSTGKNYRDFFNAGKAHSGLGEFESVGLDTSKLIYWGESHDTYANSAGDSEKMTQNVIDRAYAVAASRNGISALYFSRPASTSKNSIYMGVKGSTHFTSPEVAAVNRFRNAMNGQEDAVALSNNCTVICREKGAVIVAGEGGNFEVSVPNNNSMVKTGTYTDQVSGTTWTVTSTAIKGKIGESGIAVIYDPDDVSNPQEVSVVLGDADLDGKVNIKDATAVQKSAANMVALSELAKFSADANQDKTVNVKDATAIQKFLASIGTGHPIGETVVYSGQTEG